MMKKLFILAILSLSLLSPTVAQTRIASDSYFPALGSPASPKVSASWNFYRNLNQIEELCHQIAEAYPQLAKVYSVGKSYEGNEMWGMTISDFTTGDPDKKPAIMIFANIHSNEIQATTMALYTAWYLTEMHASNDYIKELLADKTFYIIPTINPDAREYFMYEVNNPHTPRAGMIPIDLDRDGYVDEDCYEDLDGDKNLLQMRIKNPNGAYVAHPDEPRLLVKAKPGQQGEYDIIGYEGYDNDGDGKINEDAVGGYDPNRNFGYGWEPNHIQHGAFKYPLSIVENRNVVDFIIAHPNIAAGQTYHNSGGMILSPPGSIDDKNSINKNDREVYAYIASRGEEMIPGYRSMVVYDDLYTTVGSDIDYLAMGLGIFTYCNELYSTFDMFNGKYKGEAALEKFEFDDLLLFGEGIADWKEVEHPQFGTVEIGGAKKNSGRTHPGFLLESAAHRNMAYTIFHCYHTPKLAFDSVTEKSVGGGITEITATISNSRLMPTHSDWDLKNKIMRPDWITIEGADVIAAMVVENPIMGTTVEQKNNPNRIAVNNIPGNSAIKVKWLVKGKSKYTINVDSQRGGVVTYSK